MSDYQHIKIDVLDLEGVRIHCVRSPAEGEMVNAQIVETSSRLVLVDTLMLVPFTQELRRYIESLGKPLERVVITHAHPDHWFGLSVFTDVPSYAFAETIEEIRQKGGFFLSTHRSMHGGDADRLLPLEPALPARMLEEGVFEVDGVRLNVMKVVDTETSVMAVIELPDHGTLLAQDLIYNRVYLFVGERTSSGEYCFDSWIAAIRRFERRGYDRVVPGHGKPTDASVFSAVIEYLEYVKKTLGEVSDGEALKSAVLERYPDYQTPMMLDISNFFLFNAGA